MLFNGKPLLVHITTLAAIITAVTLAFAPISINPDAPAPAIAQDAPYDLLIYNVWSRPVEVTSDDSGAIGVAYMTIENVTDHDITLVSAQTTFADIIEIHETQMEGEVMQMRPLPDGLVIPAGKTVELKSGSYHMMLIDLTKSLEDGAGFTLNLSFDTGEDELWVVPVGVWVTQLGYDPSDIVVANAWARATTPEEPASNEPVPASMPNTAAYIVLINRGATDDQLLNVTADPELVGASEIHEMKMEGEVMQMRPLPDGLPLPAGETVLLEPGGYHLMLIDLQQELYPGETLVLGLTFESGLTLNVAAPLVIPLE